MMAQMPIRVPMPNTRLTQLIRLASASLGTSMPVAPATAVRSSGSRPLCCRSAADRVGIERRALQVDEGAAGRVGVEHPGGRRGRALDPEPHGHGGQDRREVIVEAAVGRPMRRRCGNP